MLARLSPSFQLMMVSFSYLDNFVIQVLLILGGVLHQTYPAFSRIILVHFPATMQVECSMQVILLMELSENKNHPNTEFQALHLSDEMMVRLSSGKTNNQLLFTLFLGRHGMTGTAGTVLHTAQQKAGYLPRCTLG